MWILIAKILAVNYLKNYLSSLFILNIYSPYCCLFLRIEVYLKQILMFIILVQDLIMIYIILQQN